MVKNPPANARDPRDVGWIPGYEKSPGAGNGNALQYSCWKVPWTKEAGRLQFMGSHSQTWLSARTHLFIPNLIYPWFPLW